MCLAYSNRFDYKDLSEEDANHIEKDLILYNSMLYTAYKKLCLTCYYGVKEIISFQKQLEARYGTNDYFPLSAINEDTNNIKKAKKPVHNLLHKSQFNRIFDYTPYFTDLIPLLKYFSN